MKTISIKHTPSMQRDGGRKGRMALLAQEYDRRYDTAALVASSFFAGLFIGFGCGYLIGRAVVAAALGAPL